MASLKIRYAASTGHRMVKGKGGLKEKKHEKIFGPDLRVSGAPSSRVLDKHCFGPAAELSKAHTCYLKPTY